MNIKVYLNEFFLVPAYEHQNQGSIQDEQNKFVYTCQLGILSEQLVMKV